MNVTNSNIQISIIVSLLIVVLFLAQNRISDFFKESMGLEIITKSFLKEKESWGISMFKRGEKNVMDKIFKQLEQTGQVQINFDEDDFIILKIIPRQ